MVSESFFAEVQAIGGLHQSLTTHREMIYTHFLLMDTNAPYLPASSQSVDQLD